MTRGSIAHFYHQVHECLSYNVDEKRGDEVVGESRSQILHELALWLSQKGYAYGGAHFL